MAVGTMSLIDWSQAFSYPCLTYELQDVYDGYVHTGTDQIITNYSKWSTQRYDRYIIEYREDSPPIPPSPIKWNPGDV
jgi:hypothetical protein